MIIKAMLELIKYLADKGNLLCIGYAVKHTSSVPKLITFVVCYSTYSEIKARKRSLASWIGINPFSHCVALFTR